jgi:hypothetical protein
MREAFDQFCSTNADWLRPGYYLMRLRHYYRNRSRSDVRFTASFLSRQRNMEELKRDEIRRAQGLSRSAPECELSISLA